MVKTFLIEEELPATLAAAVARSQHVLVAVMLPSAESGWDERLAMTWLAPEPARLSLMGAAVDLGPPAALGAEVLAYTGSAWGPQNVTLRMILALGPPPTTAEEWLFWNRHYGDARRRDEGLEHGHWDAVVPARIAQNLTIAEELSAELGSAVAGVQHVIVAVLLPDPASSWDERLAVTWVAPALASVGDTGPSLATGTLVGIVLVLLLVCAPGIMLRRSRAANDDDDFVGFATDSMHISGIVKAKMLSANILESLRSDMFFGGGLDEEDGANVTATALQAKKKKARTSWLKLKKSVVDVEGDDLKVLVDLVMAIKRAKPAKGAASLPPELLSSALKRGSAEHHDLKPAARGSGRGGAHWAALRTRMSSSDGDSMAADIAALAQLVIATKGKRKRGKVRRSQSFDGTPPPAEEHASTSKPPVGRRRSSMPTVAGPVAMSDGLVPSTDVLRPVATKGRWLQAKSKLGAVAEAGSSIRHKEKAVVLSSGQVGSTRFAGMGSKKPDVSKVKSRVDTGTHARRETAAGTASPKGRALWSKARTKATAVATVAAAPVVSREKKVERGDGQLSHTRFAGLTSKKPDVSKVKSRVDTGTHARRETAAGTASPEGPGAVVQGQDQSDGGGDSGCCAGGEPREESGAR